jgi:hypothetical protein
MNIFQTTWLGLPYLLDKAKNLTAKFKIVRKVLKDWQRSLSKIDKTVRDIKLLIEFIDNIEEHQDLFIEEWNFRDIMQQKVAELLNIQKIYWKQRASIKWITKGDICSRFFHAHATVKHRRNSIASLTDENGIIHFEHDHKSNLLWEAFKSRLVSESKSPAGWRSAPALNPKMRRGLSILLVSWKSGKNTRTHKDLEWFGPPERNTLLHYVMYCLRACMNL